MRLELSKLLFNEKEVKDNEVKVDIAIPLLDKEKDASFTINLANYKKDDIKEYTFKIKNYHEKLNKKDINYNIVFASNEEVEYNLESNNKKVSLIW